MSTATPDSTRAASTSVSSRARATRVAGPRAAVTIGVEDLEAAHSELSDKGVEFQMPPTRQPWGATLARFADPDGNVFYLEAVSGS